jgi:hypothetical protein
MGINAPLIFGADLAKHPGWTELAVLRRKQAPQAELRTSPAINIHCHLHADSSAGHEDSSGSGLDAPKATVH